MATQDKIVPQQPETRSDLKNFPLIHCKISNSSFEKKDKAYPVIIVKFK